MKLLGVILSGGKSSRMGSDKGLLDYSGKPLIQYSIELLQPLCESIVISSNNNTYNKLGHPIVSDEIKDIGPIGGIYSVMKKFKAEKYFILSCDQPNNNIELANELIKKSSQTEIVIPTHNNKKIEPLHGVYSYSVIDKIKKQIAIKNYKLMDLLKICNTEYLTVANSIFKSTPNLFKNINSLKDLE